MGERTTKPTALAITLATLRRRDEWLYASEIATSLALLGFDTNGRALASTLAQMCRVDAPWLERRRSPFDDFEYRVTRWGRNDIDNRLPGVKTWGGV